jgi:MFS family permease
LVEETNLSTIQAAGVLSLGTLLSLSNLVWGYLADRFSPQRCFVWANIMAIGSILYLFRVDSLATAYVFSVFWGITSGASRALIPMVVAQFFGRNSYGTIAGTVRPFEAGGLGFGQSLGAIIYDLSGAYRWLFVTVLLGHASASALIFMSRQPAPPVPSSTHTSGDTEPAP